jgi:hypothetical protein
MALRKNKTEILDRIITKDELCDDYYWSYWDDDYDDYSYCENCGNYFCRDYDHCIEYSYLPDELQPKTITHISKRGTRVTQHTHSSGKLIDMTSIYSKEVLRQKRINHILGIELMEYSRPTLGDILDIKK